MTHTAESDAEIIRRRAAGETYAAIARVLGMTKNAVMGRVTRSLREVHVEHRRAPRAHRKAQEFPPRGHCLFATGVHLPYEWCGKDTGSIEMPWCPEHRLVVYIPQPKRAAT